MSYVIGFATEYYTLWDVIIEPIYRTDAYGKHWHVSDKYTYNYIKNVSKDIEKVERQYSEVPIDEELRGKTQSWSSEKRLPNPAPHILDFGKYNGQSIYEIVKTDIPYCLWLLENAHSFELRHIIEELPELIEYKRKLAEEREAYLSTIPRIKESGIVELTFTSNVNESHVFDQDDNEIGIFEVINATLGKGSDIRLIVPGFKWMSGSYAYPDWKMLEINGKGKRVKNKTFKVNVELISTHDTAGDTIVQYGRLLNFEK